MKRLPGGRGGKRRQAWALAGGERSIHEEEEEEDAAATTTVTTTREDVHAFTTATAHAA